MKTLINYTKKKKKERFDSDRNAQTFGYVIPLVNLSQSS